MKNISLIVKTFLLKGKNSLLFVAPLPAGAGPTLTQKKKYFSKKIA